MSKEMKMLKKHLRRGECAVDLNKLTNASQNLKNFIKAHGDILAKLKETTNIVDSIVTCHLSEFVNKQAEEYVSTLMLDQKEIHDRNLKDNALKLSRKLEEEHNGNKSKRYRLTCFLKEKLLGVPSFMSVDDILSCEETSSKLSVELYDSGKFLDEDAVVSSFYRKLERQLPRFLEAAKNELASSYSPALAKALSNDIALTVIKKPQMLASAVFAKKREGDSMVWFYNHDIAYCVGVNSNIKDKIARFVENALVVQQRAEYVNAHVGYRAIANGMVATDVNMMGNIKKVSQELIESTREYSALKKELNLEEI